MSLTSDLRKTLKSGQLLQQALTVPTPEVGGNDQALRTKERLEYLGDAILGFLSADYLFDLLTDATEGELSALRGALVSTSSLALVARNAGVDQELGLVSVGKHRSHDRLLASTLEAIVGVIYLEGGLTAVDRWVGDLMAQRVAELREVGFLPPKGRLQEWTQASQRGIPTYRTVSVSGPEHDREFAVEVLVSNAVVGSGRGASRRAAEGQAAESALRNLGIIGDAR